jgi:hypothetical protein
MNDIAKVSSILSISCAVMLVSAMEEKTNNSRNGSSHETLSELININNPNTTSSVCYSNSDNTQVLAELRGPGPHSSIITAILTKNLKPNDNEKEYEMMTIGHKLEDGEYTFLKSMDENTFLLLKKKIEEFQKQQNVQQEKGQKKS